MGPYCRQYKFFPDCPFAGPTYVSRCPDTFWSCPLQTLVPVMHILGLSLVSGPKCAIT